jgi:RND family efflux transporter MFP subunit
MARRGFKSRLRWSAPAMGLMLLAIGFSGWASRQPAHGEKSSAVDMSLSAPSRQPAITRVEAVKVQRGDLPLRAEATGYIEPWRKVEIRSEATGRVMRRTVEEGSSVGAGALLVLLDDREQRIEIEEAQADWLKSQANYAVQYGTPGSWSDLRAKTSGTPAGSPDDVQRVEKLVREGLLPERKLSEAKRLLETDRLLSGSRQGEVRAATSGLAQAEQRLERSRLALERMRIVAPFAGRIANLAVETGQQISPGDILFTLLQDDKLKVDVDVLEADIVRIRPGAPARVRVPSADNLVLEGTVQTVNPQVNSETGTGKVTVATANPRHLLLSGLFASVELETNRLRNRLLVPASALLVRQGRDLVFRIDQGRALWSYVQVGKRSGDLLEILGGLEEGSVVATGSHFALAHEAPVEVVPSTGEHSDNRIGH